MIAFGASPGIGLLSFAILGMATSFATITARWPFDFGQITITILVTMKKPVEFYGIHT